jgi:hypothetical protein
MSGKIWVTDPTGYLEPKVAPGDGSPVTVMALFKETAQKHANEKAMGLKRKSGETMPEDWKSKCLLHSALPPFLPLHFANESP